MSTQLALGYKQTDVGVIPVDWDAKTIGQDVDLLTGFPFPSAGYSNEGIRLLRGSNVKRGQMDWADEITQYWPSVTPEISRYQLRDGDLVIAMDGSLVGRNAAQLTNEDLPALLLQRVARIRTNKIYEAGYLAAFFKSDWFIKHTDAVKTVTAIPHISPTDIRNFTIPVPPTISEQRVIANALSDIGTLINGLNHLIVKKRDIRQAAMQQLLTGHLRLPGFSGEWEVRRLGEVGVFLKGSGVTRDQSSSGVLPCVRYGEIYTSHQNIVRAFQSFISKEVANNATLLKMGDILFAGSGETKVDIGKCVAFVGNFEAYAGGDIVILRPINADSTYLGYALNTQEICRQKASRGQGDAVVHISATALSTVEIKLPPKGEQTAIATILSDMDKELAVLEARHDKARQIKQGMMQELLTGRIRLA